MSENPSVTLPGTVEKIIKPITPDDPEKAQIAIEGGNHLYREIRIENTLTDENGDKVKLKEGAEVAVTVEAPADATAPTAAVAQSAPVDTKASARRTRPVLLLVPTDASRFSMLRSGCYVATSVWQTGPRRRTAHSATAWRT